MPELPRIHNPRKTAVLTRRRQAKERAATRTFATGSATWRKIRAHHLALEPLCRECRKHGRITTATVVDHIDGNSTNNDSANFQSLCKFHHDSKTGKETGFGSDKRRTDEGGGRFMGAR